MNDLIKILYVDDEPMNLRLFTANFRNRFDVITALSGPTGLDKMREQPGIRAVISDMRMPEMDGMEFIRLAKATHPDVSFFVLTGYDLTDEIAKAMREGLVRKFFHKPFNIKEIEESIRDTVQ